MNNLMNLKYNLFDIQNKLHKLENSSSFKYAFCDIIKDLKSIRNGCSKFKNAVMKKEVLPSRYIKPVRFVVEGQGSDEFNHMINHINKNILNLDDSLLSSKNYNDIYKFVRTINSIEKNALKLLNYINSFDHRSVEQRGGGSWDEDFKVKMDELSSIGTQLSVKMNETSSLIQGLEDEYTKMKPIYDEKMKIVADNCFPECSIVDGKWAGQGSCAGHEVEQEKKARKYFNDHLKPGNIYLEIRNSKTKNKQEIDPLYRCKSSSTAAAPVAAVGDCFPKCALNDLGQWKGWSACTSTDEISQEERARTKWETENSQKLEIGTDDFLTVIDPKYRCAS